MSKNVGLGVIWGEEFLVYLINFRKKCVKLCTLWAHQPHLIFLNALRILKLRCPVYASLILNISSVQNNPWCFLQWFSPWIQLCLVLIFLSFCLHLVGHLFFRPLFSIFSGGNVYLVKSLLLYLLEKTVDYYTLESRGLQLKFMWATARWAPRIWPTWQLGPLLFGNSVVRGPWLP